MAESPMSPIARSMMEELNEPVEVTIMNPTDEVGEGMLIDLEDVKAAIPKEGVPFDANLAEYCDDDCLRKIGSELTGYYLADRNSRGDWEKTYIKGLDQLGLKIEDRTTPGPVRAGWYTPSLRRRWFGSRARQSVRSSRTRVRSRRR